MKTITITLAAASAVFAGAAFAQTAPEPATQAPAPATATAPAHDWHMVSRSGTRAYMADVSTIKTDGDVTGVTLARVPLAGPPTDKHHTLVEMQFRCAAKQSRELAETDYDDAGVAQDRSETGEEFSDFRPEGLDAYLAAVACDGNRSAAQTYPSVDAFIAAGRPAT